MIGAAELRETATVCVGFLRSVSDRDWTVGCPGLDLSVVDVVAHAGQVCLWYGIDLAAGGTDLLSIEQRIKTDGDPASVLDVVGTFASVTASVIAAASPSDRGFHPAGTADPSGFAAMACDELLIHTDDAARGLGETFTPPAELVVAVLERLFPWIEPDADPWSQLRWANGRIALGDVPQLEGWSWYCKPLAEWTGEIPSR